MTIQNAESETQETAAPIPTFAELGLDETLLAAVDDLGYTEPTPIQARAIPVALEGRDVLAAAETGTGKTAAFLLPTMQMLPHAAKHQGPLMLIVTPTRELALQIEDVATKIAKRTHHSCLSVIGGVSYDKQRDALARGCDILIATPGRLMDLMNQGVCQLDQVVTLVLDEADRMLDMGFLPDIATIVSQMPGKRQTLLFSATLDESVLDHTRSLVDDPVSIEIAHKGTAAETVNQYALAVSHNMKTSVLLDILNREGSSRVIVFCNGKHRCDALCKKLRKEGISCLPIHGDRSQNQRQRALSQFADGMVDVLVATDVLARGIDVSDVSYVINYDVPHDDIENYIHRIGRTGRAGEEGWALTFVEPGDYLYLRDAEKLMGQIVPDFPRADGIDVGTDPGFLDPERNTTDKLPGKKYRRQMERKRTAERHEEKQRRRKETTAELEKSAGEPIEHLAKHAAPKRDKAEKAEKAPARHVREDKKDEAGKKPAKKQRSSWKDKDDARPKKHAGEREDVRSPKGKGGKKRDSERKDWHDGKKRDGERREWHGGKQDRYAEGGRDSYRGKDGRKKKASLDAAKPAKKKRRVSVPEDRSPKAFGMRKHHRGALDAASKPKRKSGRHPGDHGGRK